MANSRTSKSALTAKDDVLGADGHFTFSIADLLGNDPGSLAKVDTSKQFFFGDTAADQADQLGYLTAHGITDNHNGTYTITSAGDDFNYFVQIGNKGTWSEAHVDVTAPPAPPSGPHAGALLLEENFDNLTTDPVHASVALGNGWVSTYSDPTFYRADIFHSGVNGFTATSGNYWFDTMAGATVNSAASYVKDFTATNSGKAMLSFDIGVQDYTTADGHHLSTLDDPLAAFSFHLDGVVIAAAHADEIFNQVGAGTFVHFDVLFNVTPGTHTFEMTDNSHGLDDGAGFALDSIQIHDWIV
jgi:hypothetical protein